MDLRNFVALDVEQERLRAELLIDGVEYEYRQGEGEPTGVQRFGLVDATIALACSQPQVDLAVQAKREISKLWEDLSNPPYTVMFNSGLTGLRLWHLVQLLRKIDEAIEHAKDTAFQDGVGRTRNVLTHGNRFIAHKVFHAFDVANAGTPNFKLPAEMFVFQRPVTKVAGDLEAAIDKDFSDSYLASLFKNVSKCRILSAVVGVPGLLK